MNQPKPANTQQPPADPSPWFILGTGAMGGLWASALHRAGADVKLLQKPGANSAHRTLEIEFEDLADGSKVALSLPWLKPAALAPQSIGRLIIATKAGDAASAVNAIAPALQDDCLLVCLANGMGYQSALGEILDQHCASAALSWAVSSDGAMRSATGPSSIKIVHTGHGHTRLGRLQQNQPQPAHDGLRALEQRLAAAGLNIGIEEPIEPAMWEKFLINCAINPLTALYRCRNGELLSDPDYRQHLGDLCAEMDQLFFKIQQRQDASLDSGGRINRSTTIRDTLTRDTFYQRVETVLQNTAANQSSMLQDVLAGRRTELRFLNGYANELATEFGIDCPVNRQLLSAVGQAGLQS